MSENQPSDALVASLRSWAGEVADAIPAFDLESISRRPQQPPNRRRWAAAAAAVLLVCGVAGVVWMATTDDSNSLVDGPHVTFAPPPAVDGTIVRGSATGEGATAGVEVTIETPREVLAGTRTPIDVTVRNSGSTTIYWQAGGCAIPTQVMVGPIGVTEVAGSTRLPSEPRWDGDPDTLAEAIESTADDVAAQGAQPISQTGWNGVMCTSDSLMQALAPGDTIEYTNTAELRVRPGPLPENGTYEASGAFVGYASDVDYHEPFAPVEARVPVTVVDHPARAAGSIEQLAAAALDDGRLTSWLPTTTIPDRPDLEQNQYVALTWWRDAWELWVRPHWGWDESLRLRIDPTTLTVTDARLVQGLNPPEDEPDAARFPGMTADELLGSPTAATPDGATTEPPVVRSG
jgi:hypothetical protein